MDERRLTAWLITEQVLTSDQIKEALETQIKLQRKGETLDIIGIVRRLKMLSDVKVAEVLETTGYRPPVEEVLAELVEAPAADAPEQALDTLESLDAVDEPDKSGSGWGSAVSGVDEVDAPKDEAQEESGSGWGSAVSGVDEVEAAPAPAKPGMDERRLTAWLITQQVLTSDQIKGALEEQIRLRRRGTNLDIIGVARQTGLLTDAQVVDVLEKTSYQSSLEAPSAATIPVAPPPTPAERAAAESATPAPASPGPNLKGTSGVRRSVRPRKGSGAPVGGGLIAAAALVPIALLILVMMFRSVSSRPLAANSPRSTPTQMVDLTARTPTQELLDRVRREVDMIGGKPSAADLAGIRAKLAQLKRSALGVSEAQAVWAVERRLDALANPEGSGEGFRRADNERIEGARVEQAWQELASNFREILRDCAAERPSSIQLAVEALRKVNLRQKLSGLLDQASSANAVASLAGAPELYPVVGVPGYESLIYEVDEFPQALRDSERWKTWQAIVPRFRELRDKAAAYTRGIRRAELAAELGDLESAQRAFADERYGEDPWFKAARALFLDSQVVAAFARIKKANEESGAGSAGGEAIPLPRRGGDETVATWGATWQERFITLEQQYRQAAVADKSGLAGNLGQVLTETLGLARRRFSDCREIVAFYDEHPKVFRDQLPLKQQLRQHHELYFDGSFAAASGPNTFRALDKWCDDRGYEAWRARLKPYLRLVAAAPSRAARARQGTRRMRAEAKLKVEEFSKERLEQVGSGFASVLRWMRKRGYAPPQVKQDLGDMIARSIERAGNPIGGRRLRQELAALEHTADESQQAKLAANYDKQVQGVIDDIVKRSLKAVVQVVNAGEPGLAFDLFQYVLTLDPENDRAHKGLGHVKVGDRWLRKFAAQQLRDGYEWDERLGWVKADERKRYEQGEFYDRQAGKWTTVEQANRAHGDFANHWTFRTEHFVLNSSSSLAISAQISTRLEAFYLAMFRQYDLFFAAQGGAKLIFGMSPSQQKPLVVNFYRDQEEFKRIAQPGSDWAAGFYSGGKHASFFYNMGNGYSGITVLQHEVTHQILGETAGSGGGAPSWLAEGAAVFLEDAFFRDGVLTLGELKNHSRVVAYRSAAPGGNEHSFTDMLGFRTGAEWDSGDISKNYRGAGAVVYFLCSFDDGRFRADFVEFLRDSYNGRNPKLEDYFGLPVPVLDALMKRFYDPKADITGALSGVADAGADLEAARDAFVATCKAKDADLDQLTEAYGMIRGALAAAEEKAGNKARSRAANSLVSLRKRLTKTVQSAVKSAGGKARQARYQELTRLRQEALAIIFDMAQYPDENHGKAGQPLVDEKVAALQAFWDATPSTLETPEVQRALELLDATEPWLDELEVSGRKRGKSIGELRRDIRQKAGAAGLVGSDADAKRQEKDAKVRAYNAGRTDLPAEIRRQVEVLNDYREMLGRHALAINAPLCTTARKHSEWMERTGTFDHMSNLPGRRAPQDRAGQEGYTAGVGENIAFGYNTPESVHVGWYNSSGHHRNMTSADWHEIGVGRMGSYWTQNFGAGKPSFLQ